MQRQMLGGPMPFGGYPGYDGYFNFGGYGSNPFQPYYGFGVQPFHHGHHHGHPHHHGHHHGHYQHGFYGYPQQPWYGPREEDFIPY
jgi:hypothetical protein